MQYDCLLHSLSQSQLISRYVDRDMLSVNMPTKINIHYCVIVQLIMGTRTDNLERCPVLCHRKNPCL